MVNCPNITVRYRLHGPLIVTVKMKTICEKNRGLDDAINQCMTKELDTPSARVVINDLNAMFQTCTK